MEVSNHWNNCSLAATTNYDRFSVLTKEDATVTDAILMNRAKAILVTGAILKSVVADDDDSERRGLER